MHASIILSHGTRSQVKVIDANGGPILSIWFDDDRDHAGFVIPGTGPAAADYARQLAQQLDDAAEQLDASLAAAAVSQGGL